MRRISPNNSERSSGGVSLAGSGKLDPRIQSQRGRAARPAMVKTSRMSFMMSPVGSVHRVYDRMVCPWFRWILRFCLFLPYFAGAVIS